LEGERGEVTDGWSKTTSAASKLYTLNQILLGSMSSENIGEAYSKERRDACKISVGNPTKKIQLGDLQVDERTILKWILKRKCNMDFSGKGEREIVRFRERGNEPSGFVKDSERTDYGSKV
jgi:hypothetical protein